MNVRPPRRRNPALLAEMARQGFSNKTLSTKTGLTAATISRVLNNRVLPTQDTQTRISRALGVHSAALFASSQGGAQ